jgi:hypothetical protein
MLFAYALWQRVGDGKSYEQNDIDLYQTSTEFSAAVSPIGIEGGERLHD